MITCHRCGAEVPAGMLACAACGAEVTDPGAKTVALATGEAPAPAAEEADELLPRLKRALSGDYDVERVLGRGGMGVVYRAVELELQRPVALKILPPGLGLGPAAVRFKREARMAAALDHPNIIPIYRVGLAAGTYYFAMKLVEGRALDEIIEAQGALPLPVIVAVLRSATAALAFAHERGTVHRDIKGANILVDRDGRVLVSDFGIARAVEDKSLTASGAMVGTPFYMSPESCAGRKVGPQSDQYSLGILLFQMITGSVPFDADSLMAIIQHHYFTPVPDVRTVREGLPESLIRVLQRAVEKDPARRYPTTAGMLAAVEEIPFSDADRHQAEEMLRQLSSGAAVPKVRTKSLPPLSDIWDQRTVSVSGQSPVALLGVPRTPSRDRALAAILAVAALGAGGVWWVLSSRRPASPAPTAPPIVAAAPSPRPPAAAPSDTAPAARPRPRAERASAPTAPAAPAARGLLRLRTLPPDARILVDGVPVGVGGVVDFPLAAGRRRLRLVAAGFATFDTVLVVAPGATTNLGQVTLKSLEGGP